MRLIVISQNGCNPCTMVKNFLEGENVNFDVVNISEEPEKIEEYGVMGTPVTILIDDDGEEVTRVSGFNPPQLEVLISQV